MFAPYLHLTGRRRRGVVLVLILAILGLTLVQMRLLRSRRGHD